jgi:hypothetical protein
MTSMSDYRSWTTAQVVPPKPASRVMPKMTDLEATLAAMKADAERWKKRKAKALGEDVAVCSDTLSSRSRTHWTQDEVAELEAQILAILLRDGPMSRTHLQTLIRGRCNRHKLRDVMTHLAAEGAVKWKQVGSTETHWSIA